MLGGGSPVDAHAAKKLAQADTAGFTALLDLIGDAVAAHLASQLDAGANLVQIFDSHAGLLSEMEFAEWVVAPTRRVVQKLRERHPQALVIGFPRGASQASYQRYAAETGVDAVSLDTTINLSWAIPVIGPRVALQGNLDPELLVEGGPALDQAVDNIVRQARGTAFIFNLGHGVLPQTPIAHVERMLARVRAPA
jgi:uroporphyrinogen decarboxylase